MKRRWIILAGILGISVLVIIIYSSRTPQTSHTTNTQPKNTPSYSYNAIKSQLRKGDVGVSQETDPYDLSSIDIGFVRLYNITVFGTLNLTEKIYESTESVTVLQRDITAALLRYGEDYLEKKYNTLTIIPSSIEVSGSSIKMLINLGETNKRVAASITILNNLRALVIIDADTSAEDDFVYAGGLYSTDYAVPVTSKELGFSVKQQGYSRNLQIDGAVDKEKALNYIASLGYAVPDFTITFTGYRSPFE